MTEDYFIKKEYTVTENQRGGNSMQENFETFEQYCIEKQHNVILEEHFLPNGERQIVCRSKKSVNRPTVHALSGCTSG